MDGRQHLGRRTAGLGISGVAIGLLIAAGVGCSSSFASPSLRAPPARVRSDASAWSVSSDAEHGENTVIGMSMRQGTSGVIGGILTGLAAAAVVKGRRKVALNQAAATVAMPTLVKTPKDTFFAMVEKGEGAAKMSVLKTLHASFMGGCYVGMAGLLSLVIAAGVPEAALSAQKFVFAALFPVNLLLVLQTGGQLFTGNTATLSAAVLEGKATWKELLKNWVVSYIGNVLGCGLLAVIANYTGMLTGSAAIMAQHLALKKCHQTFGQAVVKAIMCNWLVCLAVFLSTSASDLSGKMVGIWFPISTFVAIGFEHSVANMFILPAAIFAKAPITPLYAIVQNMIPVTIGNALAGAIVISAGFSYAFGRLGNKK